MSSVFVHVGGSGVGIAKSFWELTSHDHARSHLPSSKASAASNTLSPPSAPSPFFSSRAVHSAGDSDRARLEWLLRELSVTTGPTTAPSTQARPRRASKSVGAGRQSLVKEENAVSPSSPAVATHQGTFDEIAREQAAARTRARPRTQQRKGSQGGPARMRHGWAGVGSDRHSSLDSAPSRGGNWALGYYGCTGGEGGEGSLALAAVERIRKEAETCDLYSGSIMVHSAVGGCGSGLASRVAELWRDAFPKSFLVSALVLPFDGASGGSPLQHYNGSLCLSKVAQAADTVLLLRNGDAMRGLGGTAATAQAHSTRPTLEDINRYLACLLSDVFSPVTALDTYYAATRGGLKTLYPFGDRGDHNKASLLSGVDLCDFITAVSPLPSNKFVEVYSTSASAVAITPEHGGRPVRRRPAGAVPTWPQVTSVLCRSVPGGSTDDVQGRTPWLPSGYNPRTLCAQAVGRGDFDDSLAERYYAAVQQKLSSALPAVTWNPFPCDIKTTPRPSVASTAAGGMGRTLTVCANRTRVVEYLARTVYQARQMRSANAYLHWYQRFGCEPAEMDQSFDAVDDMVESYLNAGLAV